MSEAEKKTLLETLNRLNLKIPQITKISSPGAQRLDGIEKTLGVLVDKITEMQAENTRLHEKIDGIIPMLSKMYADGKSNKEILDTVEKWLLDSGQLRTELN